VAQAAILVSLTFFLFYFKKPPFFLSILIYLYFYTLPLFFSEKPFISFERERGERRGGWVCLQNGSHGFVTFLLFLFGGGREGARRRSRTPVSGAMLYGSMVPLSFFSLFLCYFSPMLGKRGKKKDASKKFFRLLCFLFFFVFFPLIFLCPTILFGLLISPFSLQ
jgi:hypothetical protein